MAKLALPDFVKAIANAFVQVVEQRFMQLLAKGKDFAAAMKGLAQVSTQATPAPLAVRANVPLGPPGRGGNGQRR